MDVNREHGPRTGPLALVMATVVLQLAAAWVLGQAATHRTELLIGLLAVSFAIGLNLLRFIVWGYAHRHFPLSHTYPLTSLFFPCILLLSYLRGDMVSLHQVVGTLMITLGALAMSKPSSQASVDHG